MSLPPPGDLLTAGPPLPSPRTLSWRVGFPRPDRLDRAHQYLPQVSQAPRGKVDVMACQALRLVGPLWADIRVTLGPCSVLLDEQPLLSHIPQLPICIADTGYPGALWTVYLCIPPTYSRKFTASGNSLSLYLEMKIQLLTPPPTPKPCGSEFAFLILSSW